MLVIDKEVRFFTKPPETLIQTTQEGKALLAPANNSDYHPYQGA